MKDSEVIKTSSKHGVVERVQILDQEAPGANPTSAFAICDNGKVSAYLWVSAASSVMWDQPPYRVNCEDIAM